VDSAVSLYPLQVPPEEFECHIRCGIDDVGPDGRILDDAGGLIRDDAGGDAWQQGWCVFDSQTDLSALGAAVRTRVEHNALGFFDRMGTDAGMLEWVRRLPMSPARVGLRDVALAAHAGERALAQEGLDAFLGAGGVGTGGRNRMLREVARVAGRLGLACPAPTDIPALTVVFRLAADTPPQERHSAFSQLDYKFRQYVELWRTVLPLDNPTDLYYTAECTSLTCTVSFFGADSDELLGRLSRARARLSEQFADISWQPGPTT
jgi:hypothetical protein